MKSGNSWSIKSNLVTLLSKDRPKTNPCNDIVTLLY